jgi:hypothetical protein
MIELFKITGLCPNILTEGFSAFLSSVSTSSSTYLSSWTVSSPHFSSTNFNASTGLYTVPVTGIYFIEAEANYITNAAITISLDAGVNPAFVIRRTSPTTDDLISSYLPLINVNIVALSLRAVLGGAAVGLTGGLSLTAGDVLRFYYNADGMTVSLTLQNIFWSVYRLA